MVATIQKPSTNRRRQLRELGKVALEQLGFAVQVKSKLGVASGAQLVGTKGSETRSFAVRACLNRRVQGVRHMDGTWKTLPDVDEVVVVAPSRDNPAVIEVLGFDPEVVVQALDSALADQRDRGLPPPHDEPVFVSLDQRNPRGRDSAIPGLKREAKWLRALPISLAEDPNPEKKTGIRERLRREVAAWADVDVGDVAIDIRIATPKRTYLKPTPRRELQSIDRGNSVGAERMTEAEHVILDQYLTTILRKCKEGKVDEKNAVLDIAHAFTTLQNEGLGSVLTYFQATLDGEYDN
jgi:hypothetical protein